MIHNNKQFRIIISPGEPAGIGPDIIIMIAQKKWPVELVVCADPDLLLERAKTINLPIKFRQYHPNQVISPCMPGEISILTIPLLKKVIPGKLDTKNNNYVINTLTRAIQGCMYKEFSAWVTGPVHKGILNSKNFSFSGHTEFLSQYCQCKKTVMMLVHKKLRVALATTHIPIASVSQKITQESLFETIVTLHEGLRKYFNITTPKIYVCGLNPHSGESGHIGKEEQTIIIPTLNILRNSKHYNITGPLPADTIFQPKYLKQSDVILAMYHDQGLPVLKYLGFGQSTNITLGVPFIRTSVDHGTALELSGTGKAIPSSMEMAISMTIDIIINKFYDNKIL